MKRVAVAFLILLAACGEAGRVGSGSSSETQTSSPAATTTSNATTASPPAKGGSTATAAPRATASGSTVAGSLSLACARAGADTQTMTIVGLSPGQSAGYSTQYSDHSNELTNKTYTEGFGFAKADTTGRAVATWRVPSTAPPGPADVLVIWSPGSQPLTLSFTIAAPGGGC